MPLSLSVADTEPIRLPAGSDSETLYTNDTGSTHYRYDVGNQVPHTIQPLTKQYIGHIHLAGWRSEK